MIDSDSSSSSDDTVEQSSSSSSSSGMIQGKKIPVYFADPDMSDLCLSVGNKEFHVHKMTVACRSKYFKTLLYSGVKEKDEKYIEIDADIVAFERMLEFIYNGCLTKPRVFVTCILPIANDFWTQANALWTVLDRFECAYGKDLFVKMMRNSLCPLEKEYTGRNSSREVYRCTGCADRFIFAAKFGIDFPKCSYYGITRWIRYNPKLPDDLPDAKKIFEKITYL